MIYKFKSKAAGDVIMLGPLGDRLMQILGRAPAAQGIIEPGDMPAAISALQAAVAAEESPAAGTAPAAEDDKDNKATPVGLRARLWPMVEMLRRAHAAGEPVVWGV